MSILTYQNVAYRTGTHCVALLIIIATQHHIEKSLELLEGVQNMKEMIANYITGERSTRTSVVVPNCKENLRQLVAESSGNHWSRDD